MSPAPKSGSPTLTGDKISAENSKTLLSRKASVQKDNPFAWIETPFGFGQRVTNTVCLVTTHIGALYYCYIYHVAKLVNPTSIIFEICYNLLGGLGTTVGCHRYWTHKTFKANRPLQIILMMMHTITFQYPIYKWCLDHRIHHKYTDTEADPYNSRRGFWFSHMGWLFLPKTKELKEKLKTFDMPDLENDPLIRFQARYYYPLVAIFHFAIPISVYYFVFDMPLFYGFLANCRCFVFNFHSAACVNSVAHHWGTKPYDKFISSVDNKVLAVFTAGEAYHNYHHTFPWDYRASEFAWKLNYSTVFIDFFGLIGWAWDMKTVPENTIVRRMKKTGDGSRATSKESMENSEEFSEPLNTSEDSKPKSHIWGWGDESITDELKKITRIVNAK